MSAADASGFDRETFADILAGNETFVSGFQPSGRTGRAAKGLAIVTCMDSRVLPLEAVGMSVGDAKILRNAAQDYQTEVGNMQGNRINQLTVVSILFLPKGLVGEVSAIELIRALKADFWSNVRVLGGADTLNQSLERAGRVADFFELGELMCIDALHRRESCGGHFRAESQTEDGEALRHDDEFAYVAAWEWGGEDGAPILHKEDLVYEFIEMKQRSYK